MAELSPLAQVEQDRLRRQARRILAKDDVARGNIDLGPATAQAVLETPSAETHANEWGNMSRVEQAVNAIEGNWHNRQKSQTYADFVEAVEAADAGYSAYTDDIDGTDDESRQAVANLLSKDTDANKQYKQQQLDRALAAYDEYKALEADDYQYHTPEDIQRMIEVTKGKGFWESLGIGAKELLSGDVLGNAIYLGGSLGAIAPELALSAIGGAAGGAIGGGRLANAVRAATMAYGSYQNSYGSKMAEMLKERGIDVGEFEATTKAMMERGAEVEDLKYRASNYATGIALFDGLAGYASGLKLTPSELVRKASASARKRKSLAGRLGSELGNIGTQSGIQGVLGGAGEAVGALAAGEEVNASDVLLEMLGEFTTAPIEVLTAGVSTTSEYRRDMAKTAIAEAEGKLMENIVAVSEATAVALGNEETVAKWAQRLGAGKEVHAFAQDLVVNGQMEKLQEVDPQLAEDIKKAAEEGTTLSMPVGKVAEIAVKDASLAQEIVKDCRLSVDGMSPRQAEEFKKSGLEESTKLFDKELKRTKATVEQFKSAHNVAQKLKDELIAAGTDRNIAAAQVKPLEMHLARLAGQLGINPEALADELNLRVGVNGKGVNDIAYSEPSDGSILTGNPALDREVKNWSSFIDRLTTKPEHPVRMLAHTPAILEMLGAKYRGVFVPPHFFSGALQSARLNNPTHHLHLNITKDILKQIPAALTDPIAVFHNHDDGRYIFMLEVVDDNGATVITPVEFKADYHGAKLTMALSAYAKNHEKDAAAIAKDKKEKTDANKLAPRDDWFVRGVLGRATPMYVNRPKFSAWATERGLQDPTKNPRMAGAKTEEDWAKYKADNNKLYQDFVSMMSSAEKVKKEFKNTEAWLKAPNGRVSNLNALEWCLVRTPEFKQWFGDWENDPQNASKVVDKNGEPLVVYHGTTAGYFEIFDRQFSIVDADMGKAFYFTSSLADVETNYEGGGPDFDLKVGNLAEQLQNEDSDLTFEEAEKQAREQLFKGSYLFSVFLNIRNPAYVASSMVLTGESARQKAEEDISRDDYDDEDEYEQDVWNAVEENVQEEVEAILGAVEYEGFDVDRNELAAVLYDAVANGGITIPELKERINNLYPSDEDGYMAGNEITRLALEMLGYDGIIDSTVGDKFKDMAGLKRGDVHYLAFESNQIKSVENTGEFDSSNPNVFHQRAFAGSSALHTKFSTAFIGTGEGNRAWGWGLYFASRKEIAEFYRNAITAAKSTVKIKGREYVNGGFFDNSLMEHALYDVIQKQITKLGNRLTEDDFYKIQAEAVFSLQQEYGEHDDYALSAIDEIADLTVDDIEIDLHGGGRTFEVEIPESDELLDMQEPIEKQPAKVQEAIKRIVEPILDAENKKRDEFFAQMSRGIDGFVRDTLAGVKLPDDFNIEPLIEAGNEYVAKFAEVSESEGILEAEKVAHNAAVIKIAGALSNTAPDSLLSVVDEYIKLFEQVEEKGIGGVLPLSAFARITTESQLPKASGLDSLSNGGDFYWKLAKVLGGDEEASRLLNENGIKGNTYVGKRDGRCFVIFDDDAVQILDYWQDQEAKRGSYTPANTSTNTTGLSGLITLMEKSDNSTFMHESAHFFLDIDTLMASRLADKYAKGEELTEGEKEFLTNLGGFFQWGQREGVIDLGVTDDLESVMRAARQWSQLSTNEQRAMHELFAEGFESYLMTGEAPSNSVRKLFNDFKQWLMDVYATATRKPRPISKDVKKLYDLMFATAQEVQEVETANGMIPLFELEDEREETEAKQKGVKLSKEERAAFRKLHKEAQLEAQGIVTKAISGVVGYYVKLRDSAARKIIKDHKDRVEKKAAELREEPRYIAYDILTNGLVEDGKKLKFKLSPEALKAEGYSQETIDALDKKGFLYGRERRGLLSPNRLAAMVGADDAVQLMKDLAEGTKAKAKSPLSKAREALGWTGGMKLSVRELEAAGIDADIIAKLIMRDVAYDSSLRTDTLNSAQLAERTGHDSPVDLIAELVDIQDPRIEAASQVAAQIQMETGVTPEVYTDLQANLAAHNKARSRFLHAEYNAIARMLGQRQLAIYAAREYAKKKVLNVRLGDVKAYAYIAAEKRCARDAERAFIAGDYQACLNAKRGQILNHEMARVALEIEDKVIKAQRAARRALKSKGLYKPYQRLLARLVAAHDLTKVSDKLLRQQDDIKALIKELEDDGTPIEGLDTFLTDTTDLKDMTVETAANYIDAVKELTAVARNRQKQNLMATKARISDIVEEGTELLNEAADAQNQGKQRVEVPKGKWEKIGEGLKSFFFGHIKVQTMCRIFDQGKDNGFFWNLFIRSANKCADFESEERAKTAAKLEEILTPLFGKKGAFDTDKQLIGNKMMSKGERFAAACNMGNESNFERLIAGDRAQWTQGNIEALQNSLTTAEWDAVQKVWDLLESFRPQIAEKQKRVYGEEPEWIEPKELTVETADGDVMTLRGGYYPVKYDPYGSNRADRQNDANVAAQELRGAFQSATTNRSFVKSRVKNPNGDPLRLDMSALFSGLNDVIHDLAWHEWLIETRRVLNGVNGEGSGLRAVIRDRYGYQVGRLFEEWRTHIAEGDRVDSNPVWNYLAGKAGISLMGWSPMSAMVQLTGIGYVVPRCGAKSTMKALGMFLQRPMAAREAINKVSPLMKNRALTANRHVAEIRSRLDSGNDPWYKKYAYSMLLAVQSMVDTICWLAAYDKAMSDPNVLNDIDPDKAAIAVADQVVIDTQSSGRISDSSDFENAGDLKALTVFYTWANAALNQSYAIYKGESDRVAAFQKLVWMGLLMPTVEKLFRDMLRPEDEDDDEEFDAMSLLRVPLGASLEYHLGLLVGVREFANTAGAVVAGDPAFGYNGPAGTRGAAAGAKLLQGVGSAAGGNGWAMVSAGVDAAGALTGIPSAQINRTIKGLRAIESGQAEGMDALLAPVFGYSGRIKD